MLFQDQLSEIFKISPNHLNVIETNRKFITYRLLEKIVAVFDVALSLLFYAKNTCIPDNSIQNRIKTFIKTELENAQVSIYEQIEKIYRGDSD